MLSKNRLLIVYIYMTSSSSRYLKNRFCRLEECSHRTDIIVARACGIVTTGRKSRVPYTHIYTLL